MDYLQQYLSNHFVLTCPSSYDLGIDHKDESPLETTTDKVYEPVKVLREE